MAKIVPSDVAPTEEVHFSLGNDEFDLAPDGEHETDSADVIAHADSHPWLAVVYPEVDEPVADADASEEDQPHLAVEAGTDQDEPVWEGHAATTLAADDDTEEKD